MIAKTTVWKAGLYARLSKEDELAGYSSSVKSQIEILKEYAGQSEEIEVCGVYTDDGFTGTDFDRPDFERMLGDIHGGRINCIIVKDLSRFARNSSKSGELISDEFARLGVRFISLNEGYDSNSENASPLTQFLTLGITNIINEIYVASTSANIRGTLNINRRQGKFIGSFSSYGYLKDPEDHHKLIIDEEAAPVVREIFEKFLGGRSIVGITKDLNEAGIPSPSEYKRLCGYNYRHAALPDSDSLWCESTVRRILQNEIYIGNMVQGKNKKISYKIKKIEHVKKENWIIVENTHAPIIEKSVFEQAQKRFNTGAHCSSKTKSVDLFSGMVRCSECGRIMNKKTNNHNYGTYNYYRCVTHAKMKSSACKNHTIRIDKLEAAVLSYLQRLFRIGVDIKKIVDSIKNQPQRKKETLNLEKTLTAYKKEQEKYEKAALDLYPDWKAGIITKEEYLKLKQSLSEKAEALNDKISALQTTINRREKGIEYDNKYLNEFLKMGNIPYLTRDIVTGLIDSILVNDDGSVELNLKFSEDYIRTLDYIEENKGA